MDSHFASMRPGFLGGRKRDASDLYPFSKKPRGRKNPRLEGVPDEAHPAPAAAPTARLGAPLESALRDFVAAQSAPGTRLKYEEDLRDFFLVCDLGALDEVRRVEPAQVVPSLRAGPHALSAVGTPPRPIPL